MTIKKLADLLQECADIEVVIKEEIKKTIDEHHQDITDAIIKEAKEHKHEH